MPKNLLMLRSNRSTFGCWIALMGEGQEHFFSLIGGPNDIRHNK